MDEHEINLARVFASNSADLMSLRISKLEIDMLLEEKREELEKINEIKKRLEDEIAGLHTRAEEKATEIKRVQKLQKEVKTALDEWRAQHKE